MSAASAGAGILFLVVGASGAIAAPAVDFAKAQAVINRCVSIYHEPVGGKSHPCACPSDHMKNGRLCGRVSAHDRPSGAEPVCVVAEVTPELVRDFGTNEQAILRGRCEYPER